MPSRPAAPKVGSSAWKLISICIGFLCTVFSFAVAAVDEETFVRSSHGKYSRGTFVGANTRAEVAVVVVTHNSASDIPLLIDDLRVEALHRPLRVIVVDNQSSDGTADIVRAHTDVKFVESRSNLGYAGGINAGFRLTDPCDALLILNPDIALAPNAIPTMLMAAGPDCVGAVVPRMLDAAGATFCSLRREPSLTRAIGDALLGGRICARPGCLSEIDRRATSYLEKHDVDWATGAAVLIPAAVACEVGAWNEEFFMYSEETDYFLRIRESGRRVRFEPSAVVQHRGKGSGTSPELATLMAVNRIRYAERHHGRMYSVAFRAVIALAAGLRSRDAAHRRRLGFILNRRRWQELPRTMRPIPAPALSGSRQRGAVIVPAYNEAAVIKRTLTPLSQAAVDGFIELIVVCNGCTDDTADLARSVPGVRVLELEQGSKPAALNAGDEAATLWPRLYLDADIQISAAAVVAVHDLLARGDVLAARPDSTYDFDAASALVRSYYRARQRIPQHKLAMWGAGAYGLSATGHQRFGAFPMITGDDLFVDTQFDPDEKAVVATEPSVVKTPADVRSLLAIRRRSHRGTAALSSDRTGSNTRMRNTNLVTAVAVLRTIRGPRSAFDAAVYMGMALAARWPVRQAQAWERDDSSRSSE